MKESSALLPPEKRIFCNRTLNMRSIRAVGFDMDYTLVHYRTREWEREAYCFVQRRLSEEGWPVGRLEFDSDLFTLGLIIDTELGNVVKANRFGYVKRAFHGSRPLSFHEQRRTYSRVLVDLSEPRWVFMNTLFSLSEATLYAQAVDLLDTGALEGAMGYADLYRIVRSAVNEAHMIGELKDRILADKERFIDADPETVLTLLDLRAAGKKTVLITNSEWAYTRDVLSYAIDPHLPKGSTFRSLFDVMIVGARKPAFFTSESPVFEIVDEDGLLRPTVGGLEEGKAFMGGHAGMVEDLFDLAGEEILYVGDHIFSDVNVSKKLLRWRTALVVRELERDLAALERFKPEQAELTERMAEKEVLERRQDLLRLWAMRSRAGYGPRPEMRSGEIEDELRAIGAELESLDQKIAPLARRASTLSNPNWGLLMRAGNDKSHLARQIERNADVYTSRVSNFGAQTPFCYLRSPRGSLPHDSGPSGGS